MSRQLHLDALHRLFAKALQNGGQRVNQYRVRWIISGNCTNPFVQEIVARPSGDELQLQGGRNRLPIVVKPRTGLTPMCVELHTPCRECEKCRSKRAHLWAARAADETTRAARTWMGTLTLRPEERVRLTNECRAFCTQRAIGDFDTLPEPERFAMLHARASGEVTKLIKRLRKKYPAGALRYVCVVERHKDEEGWLHYHVLLHEVFTSTPVRHKVLADQWPLGFSTWRLVKAGKYTTKEQAAFYVAKYLSKEATARVRASEKYGTGGYTV